VLKTRPQPFQQPSVANGFLSRNKWSLGAVHRRGKDLKLEFKLPERSTNDVDLFKLRSAVFIENGKRSRGGSLWIKTKGYLLN
jgi:hypothetical protein